MLANGLRQPLHRWHMNFRPTHGIHRSRSDARGSALKRPHPIQSSTAVFPTSIRTTMGFAPTHVKSLPRRRTSSPKPCHVTQCRWDGAKVWFDTPAAHSGPSIPPTAANWCRSFSREVCQVMPERTKAATVGRVPGTTKSDAMMTGKRSARAVSLKSLQAAVH